MKLEDALAKIQGPVGFSSLVHGALSGDTSGLDRQSPAGATLEAARSKLAAVEKAQLNCKSDYAYWGYEGEAAAWRTATYLLEAAELVGPENLPDIPYPDGGGVVMDVCAKLERWGSAVLVEAKAMPKPEALSEVDQLRSRIRELEGALSQAVERDERDNRAMEIIRRAAAHLEKGSAATQKSGETDGD